MDYITTKQAANKWGISERRVRLLCSQDKINGAKRMGWIWLIPANEEKPADRRTLRHQKEKPVIRKTPIMTFDHINTKKNALDSKKPLPVYTVKSLRENMLVEWTYNSNAIEGNTLTVSETKVVLEGITIGGKSMKEHLEVINHKDAILYLEELLEKRLMLSESDIKKIHQLVLKTIDDDTAGVYRRENVIISGAKHRPPHYLVVKEQMERLISQYCGEWQALHPIERAALLHGEFVKIHPFLDRTTLKQLRADQVELLAQDNAAARELAHFNSQEPEVAQQGEQRYQRERRRLAPAALVANFTSSRKGLETTIQKREQEVFGALAAYNSRYHFGAPVDTLDIRPYGEERPRRVQLPQRSPEGCAFR